MVEVEVEVVVGCVVEVDVVVGCVVEVDVVIGCVVEVDVVDALCREVWARLGSGVGLKDSRGSGRCVGWWHRCRDLIRHIVHTPTMPY